MEYRVTHDDKVIADRFMNPDDAEGLAEALAVQYPGREYWVQENAGGGDGHWMDLSCWMDDRSLDAIADTATV